MTSTIVLASVFLLLFVRYVMPVMFGLSVLYGIWCIIRHLIRRGLENEMTNLCEMLHDADQSISNLRKIIEHNNRAIQAHIQKEITLQRELDKVIRNSVSTEIDWGPAAKPDPDVVIIDEPVAVQAKTGGKPPPLPRDGSKGKPPPPQRTAKAPPPPRRGVVSPPVRIAS